MYKTEFIVKQHLCQSCSNRKPIREEKFVNKIIPRSLFGYVQRDIEVPENLSEAFANVPPIFKNISFGRDDIGPFMIKYAEKQGLLSQPRRLLITG